MNFSSIEASGKLKALNALLRNALLFVLASALVSVAFAGVGIYAFGRLNEARSADAAVVLGASAWHDRPSPVFRERINHGIWLYQNGYVNYLIFTGGKGRNADISESSVARSYAIRNGVPSESIFIEEKSQVTFENILYARDIIESNNFDRVIIVSDPLHMMRAVTIARDLNLNALSSPTPTTLFVSMSTKMPFLLNELLFYVGYVFYRIAGVAFAYLALFAVLAAVYFRGVCAAR